MGRRVSSGVVGTGGLGNISVTTATISTTTTNQDLTLDPNGTGIVQVVGDLQVRAQGDIRFADADSSNYIAVHAPTTVATNYTLTWPSAVTGVSGYALTSDTSGNLSWSAAGATVSDETASASTHYPLLFTATTGSATAVRVSSTKFTFVPSTGTLNATVFNETSSIALKENLSPISNALDTIMQLQSYIYDMRDGSLKGQAGLVAEEVNSIIPNIVTKDEAGNPKGINYTRLSAYIVEAIKELKQEINTLSGK